MNAKQLAMLQRRKEVAERYLGFETQTEIGAALGVSQKTVSRDLEAMRQEWLTNSKEAIDRIIARQLAKLDLLEAKWSISQLMPRFLRRDFLLDAVEKPGQLYSVELPVERARGFVR